MQELSQYITIDSVVYACVDNKESSKNVYCTSTRAGPIQYIWRVATHDSNWPIATQSITLIRFNFANITQPSMLGCVKT